MEQRDRQALEDILGVLDRALEFPIPNSQILEDTTYLQDAVIRCLEVLGEAIKRLCREIRSCVHAYDQIDLEEVWMAYQLFPKIRRQVAEILEKNP